MEGFLTAQIYWITHCDITFELDLITLTSSTSKYKTDPLLVTYILMELDYFIARTKLMKL